MTSRNGDVRVTDTIMKTREAVVKCRASVFDVTEGARREVASLRQAISLLQSEANLVCKENDRLDLEWKQAMLLLDEINRDFVKYAQADVRNAYSAAEATRIAVAVNHERVKQGIARQNDLEHQAKNAIDRVNKAEQAGWLAETALRFLSVDLAEVGEQLESADNKRLLAMKVVRAHEEERKGLSREIHDGPAQAMSNVVLKAEIIEKLFDVDRVKTRMELANLKAITRNSLQDVRRIIYDLRPMSLDDLGLRPTLVKYVESFMKEYGIFTEIAFVGEEHRLADKTIILSVFRSIQECLSNIRKHAQASHVAITVKFAPKCVFVSIGDDGKGFDATRLNPDQLMADGGFGLFGMRERIEMLDGTMSFDTAPGKGTMIRILLPYEAKEG